MRRGIINAMLLLCLLPALGWAQIRHHGPGGASATPTDLVIWDDFFGIATASGTVGQLGWAFNAGSIVGTTEQDNAPGVAGYRNTQANGVGTFYVGSPSGDFLISLSDAKQLSVRAMWLYAANLGDRRIGLMSTAITAAPADDGVYFECLEADTNWFAVTRDGAASATRTDMGVAYTADAFAVFSIEHTATSTWQLCIDATCKTMTLTPPAEASMMDPFVQIDTNGTANVEVWLDYAGLRMVPTR